MFSIKEIFLSLRLRPGEKWEMKVRSRSSQGKEFQAVPASQQLGAESWWRRTTMTRSEEQKGTLLFKCKWKHEKRKKKKAQTHTKTRRWRSEGVSTRSSILLKRRIERRSLCRVFVCMFVCTEDFSSICAKSDSLLVQRKCILMIQSWSLRLPIVDEWISVYYDFATNHRRKYFSTLRSLSDDEKYSVFCCVHVLENTFVTDDLFLKASINLNECFSKMIKTRWLTVTKTKTKSNALQITSIPRYIMMIFFVFVRVLETVMTWHED